MVQVDLSSESHRAVAHSDPAKKEVGTETSPPTLAQVFGLDIYSRTVELLSAYGYKAEVRLFRLSAEIEERTVAVYVQRGDERLDWHVQGASAVPLAFRYRTETRSLGDISLFSGSGVPEVFAFLAALTTTDGRRTYLCPNPLKEWDPHSTWAGEEAYLKSHFELIDELGRKALPQIRNRTFK
ncbi:hypothetical protein [Paucibacter soli]|uniref:hypothetical protein n=1 Tax=Paucibacter soli TaxID=3133433 RepID=UPI0030AD8B7E